MKFFLRTSEIIIKGKNRAFFERVLLNNIRKVLRNEIISLENFGGIIFLETKKDISPQLKYILGIKNFSKVIKKNNLEDVKEFLIKVFQKHHFNTFGIEVSRGTKEHPLNSLKIAKEIKEFLIEKLNLSLDTKNPQIKIYLYYHKKRFFVYFKKVNLFGGLSVSASGKGLVLLSGGFDSPVASFLMMKRGAKVYFLHFHSYPQTSKESIEKVKKIVEILNNYNLGSELYLMNLLEIQKFYYLNIPKEYLVIFYRRSMMRLAEKLLKELNLHFLITGESLGQVASQTIENLKVIQEGTQSLVLRPLIGLNKEEIIKLAEKIGTKKVSQKPYEDCCSLFIPRKVKTKVKLNEVLKIEEKYKEEILQIEEKIYQNKEVLVYN